MPKRCLGCMNMKEQSPVCEHCGYNENVPNYPHQLPIGTVLQGRYTVGKVLGQGGFGITYIGWDNSLDAPVAVKEYYPASLVNRDCHYTKEVFCNGESAEGLFAHNRERFLKEAKILAKLQNVPGIVRVQNLFGENNTAYIIMEYVEGIDLKHYIRMQNRVLTVQEAFAVLRPVMYALSKVHEAELVHRDISPDNIMIQKDGSAKLLDFGAAREVVEAQVDKELPQSTEAILKHGFAPMEQYQRRGTLGPWTDVYALCATLYYCLTGKVPADAPERIMGSDNVNWRQIPGLNEQQIVTLEKGLALMPENRIRTMRELHNGLFGQTATSFTQVKKEEPKPESDRRGGSPTLPKSAETEQKKPEKKPDYPTHTVSLESDDSEANRRGGSSTLPKAATSERKKKKPIGLIAAALAVVAAVGIFALKPKEEVGTIAAPEEKPAILIPEENPSISSTEPVIVVPMSEEELRYQEAEALEEAKEYGKAAIAFGKLAGYEDARERSWKLWDKVAQRDTLSASVNHTVALKADGTVVATGRNTNHVGVFISGGLGPCDVGNWADIIAVSAGLYHTVGLKSDGTVVAIGDNHSDQCEVDRWTDIVAISAGGEYTLGLKLDGTVVSTSGNETASWEDVVAISALRGSPGLVRIAGVKADGTVLGASVAASWTDIVVVAIGPRHIVGLKKDGTVVAAGSNRSGQCDVESWTDIVAIDVSGGDESTSAGRTVGLKKDGTVVAVGFNSDVSWHDVSAWSAVAAVSTSTGHTVALRHDGSVVAVGNRAYGRCDVEDWTDILLPGQASQFAPATNADRDMPQNTETEPKTTDFSEDTILAPEKTDIGLGIYYQYELKLKNGLTADQVQWESRNPEIVSVDESGVITALKKGITEILITYGDQTATVTVRVQ